MGSRARAQAGSRASALGAVHAHFDRGDFTRDLARRVAHCTESQNPASGPALPCPALQARQADEIGPALAALGFEFSMHHNLQLLFGLPSYPARSQPTPDEHLLMPGT